MKQSGSSLKPSSLRDRSIAAIARSGVLETPISFAVVAVLR